MTVAIVTDGAAALPAALQRDLDITVVPILLTVDGAEVADDALPPAELLAATTLSTAAPGPGAFARAVRERQGPDGVLVLTMSAGMSSCHRAAELGADLEEAAAVARRVAARVRLIGVLGGLDQLVASGRVPAMAGRAGDRLGVRPMFDVHDGRIRRLLPSRSAAGAHRRMLEQLRQSRPAGAGALHVAAVHADAPDDARSLLEAAGAEMEPATAFIGGFGGALVATAGVGVTGLAWWWDAPEDGAA